MVLPLAYYGNPVLRAKGTEVEAVPPWEMLRRQGSQSCWARCPLRL